MNLAKYIKATFLQNTLGQILHSLMHKVLRLCPINSFHWSYSNISWQIWSKTHSNSKFWNQSLSITRKFCIKYSPFLGNTLYSEFDSASITFFVACCISLYHGLSFVATRCHSLSLVVFRYHSLYKSLSLVIVRFHTLPLNVPLVRIFISDHTFNLFFMLRSKTFWQLKIHFCYYFRF